MLPRSERCHEKARRENKEKKKGDAGIQKTNIYVPLKYLLFDRGDLKFLRHQPFFPPLYSAFID